MNFNLPVFSRSMLFIPGRGRPCFIGHFLRRLRIQPERFLTCSQSQFARGGVCPDREGSGDTKCVVEWDRLDLAEEGAAIVMLS